jgi:hypothetical protein
MADGVNHAEQEAFRIHQDVPFDARQLLLARLAPALNG